MHGYKVLDTSEVVISNGKARMLVAACAVCNLPSVPRLLRCCRCGSASFISRQIDPAGVLYAFSEVAVAPKGMKVPYWVGYVDMRTGIRLFARMAFDATLARLGMAVELEVLPCAGEVGRYYYQIVKSPHVHAGPAMEVGLVSDRDAQMVEARQELST